MSRENPATRETDAAPPDRRAIEELRQGSVGRLLLQASRAYNERAMAALRARGHPRLTLAHAGILPHVDLDGARLTALAERAGMTKQSASELVRELEAQGYLARRPDPDDRRAQRVVFTELGERFLRDAYAVKRALESDLERRFGADEAARFRALLARFAKEGG